MVNRYLVTYQKMYRQPFNSLAWIKHAHQFKEADEVLVIDESGEYVSILVHPQYPRVNFDLKDDFIVQAFNLPKSVQLYLFGFVWACFAKLETRYWRIIEVFLFQIISQPIPIAVTKSRNMIWDDHAISERASVFIYLIDVMPSGELERLVRRNIDTLNEQLEKIVAASKWSNNNHRVFHLCAKYALERLYYKCDVCAHDRKAELGRCVSQLVDADTGLSIEQAISYYNFDMKLIELVELFLRRNRDSLDECGVAVSEVAKKNKIHMQALAFPNGALPASGDTPYGLQLKSTSLASNLERAAAWKRLERIGHFRGCSYNETFHFHVLSHNAESAHGHHAALHLDLWVRGVGIVLSDSGGPYRYDSPLRHKWFRTAEAHNTVALTQSEHPIGVVSVERKDWSSLEGIIRGPAGVVVRRISCVDDCFKVHDSIESAWPWVLSFHFSPTVVIERINTSQFSATTPTRSLVIDFEHSTDITTHSSRTFITPASGQKIDRPSILLKSPTPVISKVEILTCIRID
jgi:hypothetical protein